MALDDSTLKYRALTEISEAFLGSRDCDALFSSLWDSLRKLIRFDFLLLMLIDEATRRVRIETIAGEAPAGASAGQDYPLEGGPSEVVWETQQPLYMPDTAVENRFRPDLVQDMQRNQFRSGLWFPLTTVRQRMGSMVFASRDIDPYSAEDRELMQHVARHVAIAVENALAFEEINALRAARGRRESLSGRRDSQRVSLWRDHRHEPGAAACAGSNSNGGAYGFDRLDSRRDRNGERVSRARGSSTEPSQSRDVCEAQLFGDSRRAAGKRNVRARKRRLHRSAQPAAGARGAGA